MTAPILVGVDPLRHDPDAPVLAALLARATGAPVLAVAVYPVTRRPVASAAATPTSIELRGTALARLSRDRARLPRRRRSRPLARRRAVRGPRPPRARRRPGRRPARARLLPPRRPRAHRARQHGGPPAARRALPHRGRTLRLRRADARASTASAPPFSTAEEGYEALRAAAALASACGAELHAVTAVEPITWSATSLVPPYDAAAHLEELRERAERSCATRSTAWPMAVEAEGEVVVDSTSTALEQLSNDVDLLVCGSRGYGPLGRVWLGGVSRRLVHVRRLPGHRRAARHRARARGARRDRAPCEIGHA